ncbi:MAG TPA: hypothetical protein VFU79_07245 [Nitrososphaeraceae archaeon]|nr:hypothetical protein [Nitrososphaeraceae archaeon]
MHPKNQVLIILFSIIVIGLIGIPFGNPNFIINAVILELTFIILAVLIAKGIGNNKPLYVCIFLALLIIIGNSLVTAHINRMVTFSKPLNTIVLIIGGYLLQGLLIYTSILTIKRRQRFKNPKFY